MTPHELTPDYGESKRRLAAYVRELKSPPNLTSQRKAAEAFAERLESLAIDLGGVSALLSDVEEEHDKDPGTVPGPDGLPVPVPDWGTSYQATLGKMRDLAATFRRVAAAYPASTARFALPAAALGLVAIWYEHGKPRPSLYVGGEAVRELAELCEEVGIVRSAESYKAALSNAMEAFEPTYSPPWVHHVLTGRWE